MTDKDKLKTLFDEMGIQYQSGTDYITLSEGDKKVSGYFGFYTRFDFDDKGKFEEVGAYE
jgi:hypothetical protein